MPEPPERSALSADLQPVDADLATRFVRRWLDESLTVQAVRQLNGGMVNQVYEWVTDGEPASVVAKVNHPTFADEFRNEMAGLTWYRQETEFPVPAPLTCFEDPSAGLSGLLMEKIEAATLAEVRYNARGKQYLQRQLAGHVAALHRHTRDRFGSAVTDKAYDRWLDVFAPMIEREFHAVREQLNSRTRSIVEALLHRLDHWLPEQAVPTLVHGDLWATNILVQDAHPARPHILAFIDGVASYADPEYELAYLRLFHTADDDFFSAYAAQHQLRPGFELRCRIYWLNTMLLHVRRYGERYLPACEKLAQQMQHAM